jgi:hypothetical protein
LGYRRGNPCLQIHPLWEGSVSESQTEHVEKFRTPYHFHNFVFTPPHKLNCIFLTDFLKVLCIELGYLHTSYWLFVIDLYIELDQHSDISSHNYYNGDIPCVAQIFGFRFLILIPAFHNSLSHPS